MNLQRAEKQLYQFYEGHIYYGGGGHQYYTYSHPYPVIALGIFWQWV